MNHYGEKGEKIILFGYRPSDYSLREALKEAGLQVSGVCDFQLSSKIKSDYITVLDYQKAIYDEDVFFFVSPRTMFEMQEVVKYLKYNNNENFALVFEGWTKDFKGKEYLKKPVFDSIEEVFGTMGFINHWNEVDNLRNVSLNGLGYWDVPYMLINKFYRSRPNIRYMEVGPGNGVMSLALKKLIDMKVTWICIPNEEKLWGEIKRESFKEIIDKYNINIQEGFIEVDEFKGQYDIIVLAQVMEHFIFNPVNTLKKLYNMLDDEGRLFVSVPEEIKHYNVISFREMPYPEEMSPEERERRTQINNFGHFHEYSFEEATGVFLESGFINEGHIYNAPIHHFMLRKNL